MITIRRKNLTLGHKTWLFPGGEVGVKLDVNNYAFFDGIEKDPVVIVARVTSSNDLMELVMVQGALEQVGARYLHLMLPYVPYGRQDRVCDNGEALSVKAFAAIINTLTFETVTILDPHSDVALAVLDR